MVLMNKIKFEATTSPDIATWEGNETPTIVGPRATVLSLMQ